MEGNTSYQFIILGAGPAGMQLGNELKLGGADYKILERGSGPGTFYTRFPRHRTLISINKGNSGSMISEEERLRYDWNSLLKTTKKFPTYTDEFFPNADLLVKYLADVQMEWQLNISFNTEIVMIKKDQETGGYQLTDKAGTVWKAKVLIAATGWTNEKIPHFVKGVEGVQTYGNHDLDKMRYKNKSVLIIGKGNSAFETADYLTNTASKIHVTSPHPLTHAWFSRYVGHVRAVNNNFLDTYLLKSGNNIFNFKVHEIRRAGDHFEVYLCITHKKGGDQKANVICYDEVISCAGFVHNPSIYEESLRPDLCAKSKFPLQKNNNESLKSDNLFYAGTITHIHDVYESASGFIHGFRYNSVIQGKYLLSRYMNIPLPQHKFTNLMDAMKRYIFERINIDSGMFLQQNFIVDALVVEDDGTYTYYDNLTMPLASNYLFNDRSHYYVLALGFGDSRVDSLKAGRILDPSRAYTSDNIHPIIRRYNKGVKLTEFHMLETLDSKWFTPHVQMGTKYLEELTKIPSEQLERREDYQESIIDLPSEQVWYNFYKSMKLLTQPVKPKYVLIEDNNVYEQSSMIVCNIPEDADQIEWDLRITLVCNVTQKYIIDVYPYGQMKTKDKIRSTFQFMILDSDETKTKMTWKTEWLSDLNPEISEAFLRVKKEFPMKLKETELMGSYLSNYRIEPIPSPNQEVLEMRKKLQDKFTIGEGRPFPEHLKIFQKQDKLKISLGKLQEAGIAAFPFEYHHNGGFVVIDKDYIASQKDTLDELAKKVETALM